MHFCHSFASPGWISGCIIGWVDIGTGARVPSKFVVYLEKVGENYKKFFLTK
jgi:hypothetical protein